MERPVQYLLSSNADGYETDRSGLTALRWLFRISEECQEEFARLLISHSANVDAISKRAVYMPAHCMTIPAQCIPVHFAVCMRNEKAVRTLLSLGADLDVRNPFFYSLAGVTAVEGLGLMETPLNPRRLSFGIGMDI